MPYYSLNSTTGDHAALCDTGAAGGDGRVVGQWTYSPYGEVLTAEHLHAFPQQRVGHKGLFADRLDAELEFSGAETPRLIPFAHYTYQNRNRVYVPAHGRFLQRDTNQTAAVLLEGTHHGELPRFYRIGFDVDKLYTDGINLYQYLGSNSPLRNDPMGLMLDMIVPGPADMITGALEGLVTEYADRLEVDVEWALDWKQRDDGHSRLENDWIWAALFRGVYNSFAVGPYNPLDVFVAAALPPAFVVKANGVTIRHYYHSGDHGGPVHLHVRGDGHGEAKVGPNGLPTEQSRELTPRERRVVERYRSDIKRTVKRIQRWLRVQPGDNPFRKRRR